VVKQYAPPGLADAALNLLKKTPFGSKLQQAVSDKLKTTGAAYAQVIITTSTIAAGAGSLIPCQKARLITTISVGANATILGKDKGKVQKDIFHQEKTIVVPPRNRVMCSLVADASWYGKFWYGKILTEANRWLHSA